MQKNIKNNEYWLNHKKAWESSGLSQRGYCKQEGLCSSRLNYHINRINAKDNKEGLKFIKAPSIILKKTSKKTEESIRIGFPNGVVIDLKLSTDLSLLQVIEAVRSTPC